MMQWQALAVARRVAIVAGIVAAILVAFPSAGEIGAQPRGNAIYMTAVEFRGTTTSDNWLRRPWIRRSCRGDIPTRHPDRPIRLHLSAVKSRIASSVLNSSPST